MSDDRETIIKLIDKLNQGLIDGTLTPDQEEKLREDIGDLQMNVSIGDLID